MEDGDLKRIPCGEVITPINDESTTSRQSGH